MRVSTQYGHADDALPRRPRDVEFRDRFGREARVISQLDHPHICALYGRRFIIAESTAKPGAQPLTVIVNWPALLGREQR